MTDDIERAFQEWHRNHTAEHKSRHFIAPKTAFRAGAEWAAPKWVKIEDMLDEWRDGREVDLYVLERDKEPYRLNNCRYKPDCPKPDNYSNWKTWNYCLKKGAATHAMLPPQPPEEST